MKRVRGTSKIATPQKLRRVGFANDEELVRPADQRSEESDQGEANESESEQQGNGVAAANVDLTPVTRGRGRPKGSKKQKTPSPPPDAQASERYFFQNRPGAQKTSDNQLNSTPLLNHEAYHDVMKDYKDPHSREMQFLQDMHSTQFEDWRFELEQGFSICLYGWGSKKTLLEEFAEYLNEGGVRMKEPPKIVIVEGYRAGLTLREILTTIASVVPFLADVKLPSQPTEVLQLIVRALTKMEKPPQIALLVHSIDAPPLRRNYVQSVLAQLAQIPQISFVASADTPNFLLLWTASMRSQFKWLFHDGTTFVSFDVERTGAQFNVVDTVNFLLGRSGRRIQGKEGVVFVLKSLTDSARRLYALLLAENLSSTDIDAFSGAAAPPILTDDQFGGNGVEASLSNRQHEGILNHESPAGIEYRSLYRKSVQQLIATNEIQFRQLLKEFYDHEMLTSKRDTLGTEWLGVPFRRDECEAILVDLSLGDDI